MAHWRVINQLGQKEAKTDQTIRPLTRDLLILMGISVVPSHVDGVFVMEEAFG
jgi:hypothetical protein